MTWDASEIQSLYVSVTNADLPILPQVPIGHRRYILGVDMQNLFGGINLLTLGKRELGAGATTVLDRFSFTLVRDFLSKPGGPILDNALPLYIIEGSSPTTPANTSFMRAFCSAAGTVDLTVFWVDAE